MAMTLWRTIFLLLCLSVLEDKVLGVGDNFNPPNNSVITERIGAVNITFECDIFLNDEQIATSWAVRGFEGVPELRVIIGDLLGDETTIGGTSSNGTGLASTFLNELTFLEFVESLDGVTLSCGTGTNNLEIGVFFLRVYREPLLKNLSDPVRFQVGGNLMIDMELNNPAHPFPTTFQWYKNGVSISSNSSRITFGYPSLIINNVMPSDSGDYSLTATNHLLDNPSEVLGTGTGEFNLDVLFGPSIERGPEQRAIQSGEPLSLVCGTNLMGNPQATIRWINNLGIEVTSDSRLNTFANGTLVSLEFDNTMSEDTGTWSCIVTVEGTNVTLLDPEGGIAPSVTIGESIINISLTVVVAPGQPRNLTVDSVGGTWISVCWQPPIIIGEPGIARYIITATNLEDNTDMKVPTPDNSTQLNVTGLFPSSMYELRVQAVASAFDDGNVLVDNIGVTSDPAITTTDADVPSLDCDMAEFTANGGIMIYWRFIHTGGLNITSINITYTVNDQATIQPGPEVNVEDTTAFIPSLTAGYSYVAMVTAANSIGSTSVECPLVEQSYGIPQDPQILPIEELGEGSVRVSVRTLAAGLRPGQSIYFILSYATINSPNAIMQNNKSVADYINGDIVSFSIDGLMVGSSYTFSVEAGNEFGTSGRTDGVMPVMITALDPTTQMPTAEVAGAPSQTGAIAGGIIGALIVVVIVVILILVVVFFIVPRFFGTKHSYRPAESEMKGDPIGVKVEVIPGPDIGQELVDGGGEPKELQYAELENFRPPSRQKNNEFVPAPIQGGDDVVMYATVDTYKKAPQASTTEGDLKKEPPVAEVGGNNETGTSSSGV